MIFDPFIIAIFAAGLYMAWNVGANDLANAMGTTVGIGTLSLKQAIVLGGVVSFSGAVLFGSRVTETVAKGIVPISLIDAHSVMLGALAAILAAGVWVTFATYLNLPVSTSHSIVGAMLGFGLVSVSQGTINMGDIAWAVLLKIVASWVLSPVAGGVVAFLLFTMIRQLLELMDDPLRADRPLRFLVVVASCWVLFALGSNDVANAIGPLSAALGAVGTELPMWVLVFGGVGIVLGMFTWGYRIIETIGKKITELTPANAFAAQFGAAATVLVCSSFGMPVSTTHTMVGSVVGVGLAGGLEAVDLSVIRKIIFSWVLTVPIVMFIAAVTYMGLMII
ncbi:MAG: inorganic phosphate transporter [Methanocellales archaeon]|nr:inorganic phosphate transporter [Methanocellales archaeon]